MTAKDTDTIMDVGQHAAKIMVSDCTKAAPLVDPRYLKLIGMSRPALAFADPPYNIGIDYGDGVAADKLNTYEFVAIMREWICATLDIVRPGGVLAWMISEQYADAVASILSSPATPSVRKVQRIIWHETFHTYHERTFPTAHRHIFIYQKMNHDEPTPPPVWNKDDIRVPSERQEKYNDKRAQSKGRVPGSVWTISRTCGTFKARVDWHPAQLPVELVERLVLAYTGPGDVVFDPFTGSGTTAIAALRNRRRFLGTEINGQYVNKAIERLSSMEFPNVPKKRRKSKRHRARS